jgi:hypothetical protein
MSAMYDSGLFDADDVFKAYAEGYTEAAQGVSMVICLCCPHCSTCLSTLSHQLRRKLILFLNASYCPYCEIRVIPSIMVGTRELI